MGTWICTLLMAAVVAQPVPLQKKQPKPLTRVEQAEALYAKREDLGRVRDAIGILQKARAADRTDYEATWRAAKFCYYLGAHTPDEKERKATLKAGVEAGEAAVKLKPERPEGHFWLGANLGKRAQFAGGLTALSAAGDVRKEMQAVIKADPSYQGGSAYLVLGQIELETPGLFGGSKKQAVDWMEKGLPYGKENAFLRLNLAKAYLAVKRKDDARGQLDYIFAMKPDPDYLPEYKEAVAEAQKLVDKHFPTKK